MEESLEASWNYWRRRGQWKRDMWRQDLGERKNQQEAKTHGEGMTNEENKPMGGKNDVKRDQSGVRANGNGF